MITVACVWVQGNVPYSVDYVTRLCSMVARHFDQEFEFAVLTDQPSDADAVLKGMAYMLTDRRICPRIVAIPSPAPLAGWWSKLELFNPAHALGARVLYLDLDSLIVADLAPIVDFPADFALCPPGGDFRPVNYRTVRRFNSSVMVFNPGLAYEHLFEDFPAVSRAARREGLPPLWGDQDWLGEQLQASAATMPGEWFPRFSQLLITPPLENPIEVVARAGARVVLAKKPKPHVAAAQWPWFAEAWR